VSISDLPHVNAALNMFAAILLVVGHQQIKRKRVAAHKTCMLSATGVSAAFLTSYLIYHYAVGSVRFAHSGALRAVYLAILGSHTILAATVPVLVAITLWRALKSDFPRHRRIARWTYPIWLYVSVTGVIVYLMLYQLFPGPRR
jgi:putative membrane protein